MRRFGIAGETAWRVPPLTIPDLNQTASIADFERIPAVQLFIERARAVHSDFAPTRGGALAVADICRRLDGIPLALELVAAQAGTESAEQASGATRRVVPITDRWQSDCVAKPADA